MYIDYRYRVENRKNLETLIDFINKHILPPNSKAIQVTVTEREIERIEFDPDFSQASQDQSLREGLRKQVVSVTIERNPTARNACLHIYGPTCKACNATLRKRYAGINKDIIHIHHLTLISDQPGEHWINPETDLIPVCPNCHSVIHSKYPPYTIAEIKAMLVQDHF